MLIEPYAETAARKHHPVYDTINAILEGQPVIPFDTFGSTLRNQPKRIPSPEEEEIDKISTRIFSSLLSSPKLETNCSSSLPLVSAGKFTTYLGERSIQYPLLSADELDKRLDISRALFPTKSKACLPVEEVD